MLEKHISQGLTMQNKITSVAFSFIKPEFVNDVIQIYQNAVDNHTALKGCVEIKLFRKISISNEFMIVSKWDSIEARKKYLKSDFHKKTIEKLKKYRERPPVMDDFEEITERLF